jgi:hypothetical protein
VKSCALRVLALALVAAPALAQAAAGQVLFVLGRVEIQRGGQTLTASRGTPFETGDVLTTGPTGMAQLRFKDGALMSLRHGSSIAIEDYHFPEPMVAPAALLPAAEARRSGVQEGGRSVLRLVRGAFRTITGLIGKGKGDEYRVVTPAATIGIRGTDYTAAYCEANCGSSEDGLYVGVASGEITVRNDAGELPVGEGQYAYARDSGTPPEQEMAPPGALDQPTPEEEGEGEQETGEEPAPEGGVGGNEAAGGGGETEGGSAPATEGGTTTAASAPPPADSGSSTTTAAPPPPPPPPPPSAYNPPAATTTPASYAFAYSAVRGSSTNGVVLSGANVVRFTQGATTYEIGTAGNTNTGFDSASGLRWGRWSGGAATANGAAVNLANESLHWIYAASPTAPALPVGGTASFTLVGNTNPTNTAGQAGFLGSATLSVCVTCTTQVTSTLNIGINDQAWSASGAGSLANANTLFSGSYAVNVNSGVGAPLGTGSGGFTGFLSGTAAGLSYNLNAMGTTVSGSAAFVQQVPQ